MTGDQFLETFRKKLAEASERRSRDADRFASLDWDECQLCHAHGEDKRTLMLTCFYAVDEAIPEAIDLSGVNVAGTQLRDKGYMLRICKSCRGDLLGSLRAWRERRVVLRGVPKDHDGNIETDDPDRNIPVRIDGAIRMLTQTEWDEHQAKRGATP